MAYRLLDPLHRDRSFRVMEGAVRDTIVGGPKDLTRHLGDKQAEKDTEEVLKGSLRNPLTGGWSAAAKQVAGDTPESRAHDQRAAADPIGTAAKDTTATLGDDYYKSGYKDPMDRPPPSVRRSGDPPPVRMSLQTGRPPARTPLKTKGAAAGQKGEESLLKKTGKRIAKAPFEGGLIAKDLVMGGKADSSLGGMLGWNEKTSWIDRAQDVVDIVGIIDPTGVADAANALGYAARGKWGDAAVSALGVIPYAGDVAKIGKYGKRAAKVAEVAGKAGKAEGRLAKAAKVVERGAARMAEKRAARAAAKAGVHAGEKTAVRAGEAAAKGGRLERLKQTYEKGKAVVGRAKEAYGKIQARKDVREGRPKPAEREVDTTADHGRRSTGALSREAPLPSMAPPGPGPLAREREAEQRSAFIDRAKGAYGKAKGIYDKFQDIRKSDTGRAVEKHAREFLKKRKQPKDTGGGAGKGPGGATEVPVDADCPGKKTKTTTWKATPGMKRCAKQTPGREHD